MPVGGRDRRADARAIIAAAIAAADPGRLVLEALAPGGAAFAGAQPGSFDRIFVIGAGKAGAPMAAAAEEVLGERLTAGVVVLKEGHRTVPTGRIEILEAAHPVPDRRSGEAAGRLLDMAGRAQEGDLVIFLLSGGGSALTALPAGDLTLQDIRQTTEALVFSGAPIHEINAVRKHITAAAGGSMGAAAWPARAVTLVISDVIGDDLGTVASGLTFPDETTFAVALRVVGSRGLEELLPAAVLAHLKAGAAGELPETPKPGDPVFGRSSWHILGSNRMALEAAAAKAAALGYRVVLEQEPLTGEASGEARRLVARALAGQAAGGAGALPFCLLAGGEPVVTVTGAGKGGRAQEFALAAALALEGAGEALLFAAGTDGTDGPTDAAGAFADRSTAVRARAAGFDPAQHLEENDAYPLFDALGDLIITGPTGTNVNDIFGVLMG